MPPKLNRERARFVLANIDEILAWEKGSRTGHEVCRTRPLLVRGAGGAVLAGGERGDANSGQRLASRRRVKG
jgi:hypothetical protein